MGDKNKILLLKTTYWYGALLDALMGFFYLYSLLVEPLGAAAQLGDDPATRFAEMTVVSFMFGGTIILFWALRKPVERRIVLITIIVGLSLLAMIEMLIGEPALSSVAMLRIVAAIIPLSAGYLVSLGLKPESEERAIWKGAHSEEKFLVVLFGLLALGWGGLAISSVYSALIDPLPVAPFVDGSSANRWAWGMLAMIGFAGAILCTWGIGKPAERRSLFMAVLPLVLAEAATLMIVHPRGWYWVFALLLTFAGLAFYLILRGTSVGSQINGFVGADVTGFRKKQKVE